MRQGAGGDPSVVFLHAGIADHRSWEGVLARLPEGVDAVAYDRRGFGATTARAQRHDACSDLLALHDALALPPAWLVGNSQGGRIALDFALLYPSKVAGLVLVAPAVSGAPALDPATVPPQEQAIWATLEAADEAGDLEALNEGEVRFWLDGPYGEAGRVGGDARTLLLAMNRIALHAAALGVERPPPDAWDRLGEVRVPTLVVVGELDMANQRTRAAALAARIDGARLMELPGTAHLPALEQPAVFTALLCDFVGLSA